MRYLTLLIFVVCGLLSTGCAGSRYYNSMEMQRIAATTADIKAANDPKVPVGNVTQADNLRLATELGDALKLDPADLVPRVTTQEWIDDPAKAHDKSVIASQQLLPAGTWAAILGGAAVAGIVLINLASKIPGPVGEFMMIAKQLMGGINPKELKVGDVLQQAIQTYKLQNPDTYVDNPVIKEISRAMGSDLKTYVKEKHGEPNAASLPTDVPVVDPATGVTKAVV